MKRLNYLPVFFVAAAVSMGTVLEVTKGLEVLTNYMFAWMEPFMTNIVTTTIVMYWTAFAYHFLLQSCHGIWQIPSPAASKCRASKSR
jgi:hypothetical protein